MRLNGAAGNSVEALIRLGRYDEAEALLAQTGNAGVGSCAPGPSTCCAPRWPIRRGRFDEAGQLQATADELTVGLADVQQRGVVPHAGGRAGARGAATRRRLRGGRAGARPRRRHRRRDLPTRDVRAGRCGPGRPSRRGAGPRRRLRPRQGPPARPRARAGGRAARRGAGRARGAVPAAVAGPGGDCARPSESRLHDSDPERWAEAARRWEDAGEPYPAAYCRWREAEALLERPGRPQPGRASASRRPGGSAVDAGHRCRSPSRSSAWPSAPGSRSPDARAAPTAGRLDRGRRPGADPP